MFNAPAVGKQVGNLGGDGGQGRAAQAGQAQKGCLHVTSGSGAPRASK